MAHTPAEDIMIEPKKLAVLISCTDHYANRMYLHHQLLEERGFQVLYVTSDFHHTRKQPMRCAVPGAVQLHVRPYRKNLSADRILSHRDFARQVYGYLSAMPQEPALVIADIPPNFLVKYLAKYKKEHPAVKLVFDLFDLWPETFPSGSVKKLLKPVFRVWGGLRDHNLSAADQVLTECDRYQEQLGLTQDPKVATVYLAGSRSEGLDMTPQLPTDCLSLCYLGAINNIIDIPAIEALVAALAAKKTVRVHVIGEGERRPELLEALSRAGAQVEYHGIVYDEAEKQAIMARCHLGLNIMKSTVCIGLTMKSVDYWCHDLPIINNIGADTHRLVAGEGVGVNLSDGAVEEICALTGEDFLAMRHRVRTLFDSKFSKQVVLSRLADALGELLI